MVFHAYQAALPPAGGFDFWYAYQGKRVKSSLVLWLNFSKAEKHAVALFFVVGYFVAITFRSESLCLALGWILRSVGLFATDDFLLGVVSIFEQKALIYLCTHGSFFLGELSSNNEHYCNAIPRTEGSH